MFIHTTEKGETLHSIAKKYGVPAEIIIKNNGLKNPDRLCIGQKLVILTPTRTYTMRAGDTIERISNRFGITKRTLLRSNPSLTKNNGTSSEQVIALKYDAPSHGRAILNGYVYRGCSSERLSLAMAHAEYITVSAYKESGGTLTKIMHDKDLISEIKRHGCVPLMRIYDSRECNDVAENFNGYIDAIISTAREAGYLGITLAAYRAARNEKFKELLFLLKKRAIADGLMLLCEIDESGKSDVVDICDGCVLVYEKCAMNDIPSFDHGERSFYYDFAEKCESIKCFMDISSFAYAGGECMSRQDAENLAYKERKNIEYDPEKMICSFEYSKYSRGKRNDVRVVYESPENIKAKLALASELGFMGMSFDVMRIPVEYLMMITASFACGANYSFSSFDI